VKTEDDLHVEELTVALGIFSFQLMIDYSMLHTPHNVFAFSATLNSFTSMLKCRHSHRMFSL